VRGIFTDNKRIRANVIIILPRSEERMFAHDPSKRNTRVIIGRVNRIEPITLVEENGTASVVEITPVTRIIEEVPIDFHELMIGDNVRVLSDKIIVMLCNAFKKRSKICEKLQQKRKIRSAIVE